MTKYTLEDKRDHDAVAAVIMDDQGRVLMQDHVKFNFWTIPIGKATPGQSPEDAMIQEIEEECCITPTAFKKICSRPYMYERDGVKINLTSHIFLIQTYKGVIKNGEPEKHRSQEFKSLEEIKQLPHLSDATCLYLETLSYIRKALLEEKKERI